MIAMRDIGWAAGFMEGEGSFQTSRTCPYLEVSQVELEPLETMSRIFGGKVRAVIRKNPKPGHKNYFRWTMYGNRAAGVMMTLFPLMSEKRKQQIEAVISPWIARGKRGSHHRNMTHCKAGHEYVEGSWTRKGENGRQCKLCMNSYRARYASMEN